MSFCKCGGYLGSGGVDGYAGRWCRCSSPEMVDNATISVTGVTLDPDTLVLTNEWDQLDKENKELQANIEDLEKSLKFAQTIVDGMLEGNNILKRKHTVLEDLLRQALYFIKLPPMRTSGNDEYDIFKLIPQIEEVLGEDNA